ncbi:MAG: FliM/FliN family flagellar motor switch protein [Paracoccaceae bacterium]
MTDLDEQLSELGTTRFGDIPIEITISVGVSRPLIRELMEIDENAILPLDKRLDDPVELYVGDKLIAIGHLEEIEGEDAGRLGVRVVEVTAVKPAS